MEHNMCASGSLRYNFYPNLTKPKSEFQKIWRSVNSYVYLLQIFLVNSYTCIKGIGCRGLQNCISVLTLSLSLYVMQ